MASIRTVLTLILVVAGLAVATPASAQDFSDNVNVILRSNGILDIIGDNEDNRVTLCQNPEDLEEFSVIIISGRDAFRVETVNGVTLDVRFNMRGGNDVVQINGVTLPPADCNDVYPPPPPPTTTTTTTLPPPPPSTAPTTTTTPPPPPTPAPPTIPPSTDTTDVPPGIDVEANGVVCIEDEHGCHHAPTMLFPRDLRVLLGSGFNTFNGYDFGVVDDLTIRGGSSRDEVGLQYVNVWDRGDINLISGGSFLRIQSSYFGRSSIRASTGADNFQILQTDLGNRPIITTGANDDDVRAGDVVAEGRWTINTGGGEDDLSIFGNRGCGEICAGADHEASTYQLNVIMGAQDDVTNTFIPLFAGDRLNGGSGNMDRLGVTDLLGVNAVGGPTINGYEFIGPILD